MFAYITHGTRLLVFDHAFYSQAGLQVPAGTVEGGEMSEVAVLREAVEETGLQALELCCFLAEQRRDMSDYGRREMHYRRFYHLQCRGTPPDT